LIAASLAVSTSAVRLRITPFDGSPGRWRPAALRQLLAQLPRIVRHGRYLADNVIGDGLAFVAPERLAQPAHDLDRLRGAKVSSTRKRSPRVVTGIRLLENGRGTSSSQSGGEGVKPTEA